MLVNKSKILLAIGAMLLALVSSAAVATAADDPGSPAITAGNDNGCCSPTP